MYPIVSLASTSAYFSILAGDGELLLNSLRSFNWVSTSKAKDQELESLQLKMLEYYSQDVTRGFYQAMIDSAAENQPAVLSTLTREIAGLSPERIIELGCGSGWILEELIQQGIAPEQYTGCEFSQTVINQNRVRQPNAKWHVLTGYECNEPSGVFDVAFSYFVIEHCVYPERHLDELWRLLRPGATCFLSVLISCWGDLSFAVSWRWPIECQRPA